MRSESKPRLEIVMKNMFNMKHSKLLLPILTLLIAFSALAITTQPVRGANPNILYIAPPHIDSGQTLPASVHFAVKVFQMDSFNTWDIQVAVDPTVLNPTSLTITPNTLTANFTVSELELTNCVNGAGSGCDPTKGDGPGVVHSAVFPLGSDPAVASISGVLFNITYSVVNPAGFTTVHLMNTNIVGNGVTIVTTNQDGTYGTPPIHSTAIGLACSRPVMVNQGSTCTATVTDTSATPSPPTGTVTLSTSGTGTFSGACNLSGTTASATCTVTDTPGTSATALPRTDTITAHYGGNATHSPASPDATACVVVIKRSTSTAITCASPVVINQASSCSVTVTDTSVGTAITPTGTVTFTSTGTGSLSAASCTLTAGSCTVSFTGTAAGSATVIGTYGGDGNHNGSGPSTSNTITVNKRSTSTTVICSPSSVVVDQTSSCTATVTDTDVSTTITPTGSVAFTLSAGTTGGVLSAASCTLAAVCCAGT